VRNTIIRPPQCSCYRQIDLELQSTAKATFNAISKTYCYLTPDLWRDQPLTKTPYQEYTDHLAKTHTSTGVQRQEVRKY